MLGRYELSRTVQLGFFYEPIELYATPVGGFLGSKMVLKAAYNKFQMEVARGGYGFFYGWLAPKEGEALHSLSLQ